MNQGPDGMPVAPEGNNEIAAAGRRSSVALLLMLSFGVAVLAVGVGYVLGARGSMTVRTPMAGEPGAGSGFRTMAGDVAATPPDPVRDATRTAVARRAAAGPTPDSAGLSMGVVQRGAASLGEPAPPFALRSLDGEEPVALSDFLGRPVLVNFWATWCPPCRAEMPYLQAVQDRHATDGLVVLAVDVQESYEQVLPYVVDMGLTLPVLLDEDGDVADRYRIKTFPTTYLVDDEGVVASIKRGAYRSQSELDEAVLRLLADSGVTP
jgi:thiol-disulfide isomerase/thioredoxin